jgi:C-terminal domain of RIG-I
MMQERKVAEERRKQRSSLLNPERITIHCRYCKTFLCNATDMRNIISNYVCIDPDFELKIKFVPMAVKEYRLDSHVGWLEPHLRCLSNGTDAPAYFGAVVDNRVD